MYFRQIVLHVLIAVGAIAQSPIAATLSSISEALTSLDQNIQKWNGDVLAASDILMQSNGLQDIMDNGVIKIDKGEAMPLSEAVNILKPANGVIKQVQDLIKDLIAKKPDFDKAQLTPAINGVLTGFQGSTVALVKSIRGKVPGNVRAVTDNIVKQITVALNKGLAAYPSQ
jgi:hypothetical protein